MRRLLGTLVLISVIWTSKVFAQDAEKLKYQPALAMRCGKCTNHRDVETGEWISDAEGVTDCMDVQSEMLEYCKEVYPTLTITNVIEEAETVHVQSWCRVGSKPPCGRHSHNVKPITCVVGEYKPKVLEVDEGCTFDHTHDYDTCHPSTYWKEKAASICHDMGKTVTKPQVLKSCEDAVDHWQGVQYLCCEAPSLSKPKLNKGKAKNTILKPENIVTIDKSDAPEVCTLSVDIGICRAFMPRWFFNHESKACEVFHFGGCGGNDNNFMSREECENKCLTKKPVEPASLPDDRFICGLPSETGPCRAMFWRFAYDANTQKCKQFVFGGCMGNKNNFEDEEECESSCGGYKHPETGPIQIEPSMKLPKSDPFLNPGPVIVDQHMPTVPPGYYKTLEPSAPTTTELPYTDSTTIDNEHDVFAGKLKQIKDEHQDKVTKILAKYDEDNENLSQKTKDKQFQNLEQDLQQTIASLEDEYDAKMSSLNDFHMNKMDKMVDDERTKTLNKFFKQLKSPNPKLRHILTSLEKYIAVEQKDKTHVMQHYNMAVVDGFDEASVPKFKDQISKIDKRVNNTRTIMKNYPEIFSKIQEDVEEILSTMPASPDFELYDDYDDDLDEEVLEDPTPTEMIDDGGISDPDDICSLPKVVGMCRASMSRFYYDKTEGACKTFIYGGCGGNENSFFTENECESACITKTRDAILRAEEYDENDIDFSIENAAKEKENKQIHDLIDGMNGNYFLTSIENAIENENFLDSDVDSKFTYNGDPIDGPQAMVDQYKAASISQGWALWLGMGVVVLLIVVVIVVYVRRYNMRRPQMTITVDKPEDDGNELSPEEKQLLALQQNGYENPTYKFFEKQMA